MPKNRQFSNYLNPRPAVCTSFQSEDLLIFWQNHGYETPKQALETNSRASCGVLYPPLCGIVRLTNFNSLRFWNLGLTI